MVSFPFVLFKLILLSDKHKDVFILIIDAFFKAGFVVLKSDTDFSFTCLNIKLFFLLEKHLNLKVQVSNSYKFWYEEVIGSWK